MIRVLGPDDFVTMPWANGLGQTIEMLRVDGPDRLIWRLSRAMVVVDGPFSVFPGVTRNLTVIDGPGFDLVGDIRLRAAPLMPVAFDGGLPIRAENVTAPSADFNVMTALDLPRPDVRVIGPDTVRPDAGGLVALYALGSVQIGAGDFPVQTLILADEPLTLHAGRAIAVRLFAESAPLRLPAVGR